MFVARLLIATLPALVASECKVSHVTTCDTFEDFMNYRHKGNMTNVIIGDEKTSLSSVNLMEVLRINKYNKLGTLTVLRRINEVHTYYREQCQYNLVLYQISFYGNQMNTIERHQFPQIPTKKLLLVNNQVKEIKSKALQLYPVVEFDASENLLTVVEESSLPLGSRTRVIILRRNMLRHIQPGSFPVALKALHLDHNKLQFIQKEVFTNLTNLQTLTLSHNNFSDIPEINTLVQLVFADFSYNYITAISEETFIYMEELKLLDLSNNKISKSGDIPSVLNKQPLLTISLALNELSDLNLKSVVWDRQTLILFGNPFPCDMWNDLKRPLIGHESDCDSQLLSSGATPYCVSFKKNDLFSTTEWQNEVIKLHEAINEDELPDACNMAKKADLWLSQVHVYCGEDRYKFSTAVHNN